jgi:hypothetical protein
MYRGLFSVTARKTIHVLDGVIFEAFDDLDLDIREAGYDLPLSGIVWKGRDLFHREVFKAGHDLHFHVGEAVYVFDLTVKQAGAFGWSEDGGAIHSPVLAAGASLTRLIDLHHQLSGLAEAFAIAAVVEGAGIGVVAFGSFGCRRATTTGPIFIADLIGPTGVEHIVGAGSARTEGEGTGAVVFANVGGAGVVVVTMSIGGTTRVQRRGSIYRCAGGEAEDKERCEKKSIHG